MPRQVRVESVKGRMPVRYRVHPFIRWPMVAISSLIAAYALYFLLTRVHSDDPWPIRYLPLMILFVGLDSVFRHLTSLNSVIFTPDGVWFRFLVKPPLVMVYDGILNMEFRRVLTYYVYFTYTDTKGNKRFFRTNASFPKMLEIMYNIADLAPNVVMDEKLDKMMKYLKEIMDRGTEQSNEV